MIRFCFCTFFSFIFFTTTSAQENKKGNIISNTGEQAKMIVAKQKLYGGHYLSALNLYHEIEQNNPTNANLKYYVSLCYYNLRQPEKAKESLLKALEIPVNIEPEAHFLLGKIYHHSGDITNAISQFNIYLLKPDAEKSSRRLAQDYLAQCELAKKSIAAPLDVTISSLGAEINSKYDDKNPCITADGKSLIFTTRRPESTDSPVDTEGDGKCFENIYVSYLDSLGKQFMNTTPLDKNVNTSAHDAAASISPDGKQLFIYKNDVNKRESRGGNVFVSKQLNGKWKKPQNLGKPINTSPNWEGGACVSPDGKRYFFSSERPGGFGGSDIWMVERINKKNWGEPVNLGPTVNSQYDEAGMFLAPDGKTLFFCSNSLKSMGSYDIFRSVYENGQWSEATNLGYPINSSAKEGQIAISADAGYAYISSDRTGGLGENDIYKIDLKDYAILEKDGIKRTGNGLSILRGTIREGFEGYGMQDVEIIVKDEGNNLIASTVTNESGEYFITMHSGKYVITVKKKGFRELSESFDVPEANKKTLIVEKGYLLKK